MEYEREAIRQMAGYAPGEQPNSPEAVKLNTNENPYPPAPAVVKALRHISPDALRRYPSPTCSELREKAAELHGVAAENIVTTNGGDELLRLAITTFVEPGRAVGITEPSYSLYPVLAAVNDSPVHRIPLNDAWLPPDDFADQLNEAGCNLAFIVNPHAPSGRLLDAEAVAGLARRFRGVLVVDEAYVDFVDPEQGHDVPSLIHDLDNLLVLRTLSKGYSLAGLRLGYGIGSTQVIDPIATKTRDSYSVDAVAERLAVTALSHRDEAASTWQSVRDERERLRGQLTERGIKAGPSQTNFVLADIPRQLAGGAASLYRELREKGIFVRYFDHERLVDSLRISVGTPDQNDRLLRGIDAVVDRHRPA